MKNSQDTEYGGYVKTNKSDRFRSLREDSKRDKGRFKDYSKERQFKRGEE